MAMNNSLTFSFRLAQFVIALSILAVTSDAQSGRGWMNGFVFAESPTNGLLGASVELIGDQDNARVKSVRLSAKAEEDGKYSIENIPYGDYTFRVTAEGYE